MDETETRDETEDLEEFCFINNIYDLCRWESIDIKLEIF